jgi:DNA topoisomerase I
MPRKKSPTSPSRPQNHKANGFKAATVDGHGPNEADPVETARSAGLRYVIDSEPGIRRICKGRSFSYIDAKGKTVRNPEVLARIRSLVIPPAWTEVWICELPQGHLQATGRDVRGRKQHRYHVHWKEQRDATKFDRVIAFGRGLPKIRRHVDKDMRRRGLPRVKVLATVVKLLETSLIRVGNEEYAKQNDSFGLTTMRDRHVAVNGSKLRFEFRGKSGVLHAVALNDRRLAKIVKSCQELPGHELFQYLDDDGERRSITSADVNDYLRGIVGDDFTSKDFRTWAGTVLAARALQEFESFDSEAQAKRHVVQAIESVAKRLGNTKTVCRNCYVHPAIIDAFLDQSLIETLRDRANDVMARSLHHLEPEEAAVIAFLQERLKQESNRGRKRRAA